ncbi:MAG: spore coat associated protein CotJA [Christensenellaceae bacterium]|nr:spore coat associated protein CotJA [Christensenellaceae bacterium]
MRPYDPSFRYGCYGQFPTCAKQQNTCPRADFFADQPAAVSGLARAFVVSQPYQNCACCPAKALLNGTYFDDLHMPYVKVRPHK